MNVVNRILDVYLPPRSSRDLEVHPQVRIAGSYRPVDLMPDSLSWLEPFMHIQVRKERLHGLRIELEKSNPMRLLATRDPWTFELGGGPGDGEQIVFRADSEHGLHAYAAIYHLREAPRWTDPRLLGTAILVVVSAVVARRLLRRRKLEQARVGDQPILPKVGLP